MPCSKNVVTKMDLNSLNEKSLETACLMHLGILKIPVGKQVSNPTGILVIIPQKDPYLNPSEDEPLTSSLVFVLKHF